MCPVLLETNGMYTQVGHLVSLKTSMSKKRSILRISVLGLFAQPVTCPSLLYTSHGSFLATARQIFALCNWKEFIPVVNGVKCVPILVIKKDDPSPWVAKNWTIHPLPRAQKPKSHLLSFSAHHTPSPHAHTFWSVPYYTYHLGQFFEEFLYIAL